MGSRLLHQWILTPLTKVTSVNERLDAVALFAKDPISREALRDSLDGVRDVERLASKAAAGRGTPRDLRSLGDSIARLPKVHEALQKSVGADSFAGGPLEKLMSRWDACADLSDDIIAT